MCGIADGTNDAQSMVTRTARKAHACWGCRETILPGHRYKVTSVLYDGSWTTWKHCLRCDAIYAHLLQLAWDAYDDIAVAPSLDCGEDYEDAWGEAPPERIAALAFALPGDFT